MGEDVWKDPREDTPVIGKWYLTLDTTGFMSVRRYARGTIKKIVGRTLYVDVGHETQEVDNVEGFVTSMNSLAKNIMFYAELPDLPPYYKRIEAIRAEMDRLNDEWRRLVREG